MENMTKNEMANALAILLNMVGYEGQLMKLSIPALKAMFDTINANATAYAKAIREAKFAREELKIEENRAKSFERDLRVYTKGVTK